MSCKIWLLIWSISLSVIANLCEINLEELFNLMTFDKMYFSYSLSGTVASASVSPTRELALHGRASGYNLATTNSIHTWARPKILGGGEGFKENFRGVGSKNFMKFYSRFVKILRVGQKISPVPIISVPSSSGVPSGKVCMFLLSP